MDSYFDEDSQDDLEGFSSGEEDQEVGEGNLVEVEEEGEEEDAVNGIVIPADDRPRGVFYPVVKETLRLGKAPLEFDYWLEEEFGKVLKGDLAGSFRVGHLIPFPLFFPTGARTLVSSLALLCRNVLHTSP